MDAHHASLGRKKLAEIRQKKAADRKASATIESKNSNLQGLQNTSSGMEESVSWIGNQSTEREFQALLTYTKQLEAQITEQQDLNKSFVAKLDMLETERNSFEKQLKIMEENELPSLKKALQDTSMEKDVAITAREDLSSQLRVVKRRLREVEDEQYKAEEDAAALREELNILQRQQEQQQSSNIPLPSVTPEQLRAMEQETSSLKVELQQSVRLRQQEQQQLAAEKERVAVLLAEKQQLEEHLEATFKQISEAESSKAENRKQEKGRHDQQIHDLALMVERLESGRQKLLAEIDAQSLEIERLFVENANLSDGLKDMANVAAQWESQVQECLRQNAELRGMLDKLRAEQTNTVSALSMNIEDAEPRKEFTDDKQNGVNGHGTYATENLKLKGELAKAQTKTEELAAQVMQLSAELRHTAQAYNTLTWLYKPVLWNIENRLMQIKGDNLVSDTML